MNASDFVIAQERFDGDYRSTWWVIHRDGSNGLAGPLGSEQKAQEWIDSMAAQESVD